MSNDKNWILTKETLAGLLCLFSSNTGESHRTIRVNNEIQLYTDNTANVRLSGAGTLQIVPQRDEQGLWTSGRVESYDSWTPQPGARLRIQASIRMGTSKNAQGMWPALPAFVATTKRLLEALLRPRSAQSVDHAPQSVRKLPQNFQISVVARISTD